MVTKISFNNSSLQNSVLPHINNSIDILNSIINLNSQLTIPNGFSYYDNIKALQSSDINTKNSLIKIRDYITRSNRNFDNTIDAQNDSNKINED